MHILHMYISVFLLPQDINECLSEPCKNGGTCENQVGSYLCHCTQGFKGQNCEISAVAIQGTAFFKKNINNNMLQILYTLIIEFYIYVCKMCVCRAGRLRVQPLPQRRCVPELQTELSVRMQRRLLWRPVPDV